MPVARLAIPLPADNRNCRFKVVAFRALACAVYRTFVFACKHGCRIEFLRYNDVLYGGQGVNRMSGREGNDDVFGEQ